MGRVLEEATSRCLKPELFKEIASGLNDNRRQFHKLIERLADPDVACVIVEYKDRLTRFGFNTFKSYCQTHNVDVVVMEDGGVRKF